MLRIAVLALVTSIILPLPTMAQDSGPVIIPEQIQKLAFQFPVAERLGIKWESATPDDIGRYMGILAAANEVAKAIALKNERATPTDEEYQAAFAVFCFWPNKPPNAEPFWQKSFAAFGNQSVRNVLQSAIRPLAVELPAHIAAGDAQAAIDANWPIEPKAYFNDVWDFQSLEGTK
jgi:hypothetical protein